MIRFCLSACLILPAGAVSAQDVEFDFAQFFAASQMALQELSEQEALGEMPLAAGSSDARLSITQTAMNATNVLSSRQDIGPVAQGFGVRIEGEELSPYPATQQVRNVITAADSVEAIGQVGRNAANVVNSDHDLEEVYQIFNGRQMVANRLDIAGSTQPVSIDQTGANYANMMQGGTISLADQAMLDGARQTVSNRLVGAGAIGNVGQTGTNVANIAMAEFAIDAANQIIGHDVVQKVWNYVEFDADAAISGEITQSGVNIGNVLVADRIDAVTREFYGDQIVRNAVVLNGPAVPMITQSGSNIANLVVANHIGAVHQISAGRQVVWNTVTDGEGNPIDSGNIEQTEYNYQGASNVVNMMVLRAQREGDPQQPIAVDQQADFPQTGEGVSGQSQTGNVTVIVR